ncbi:MAG: hypothetical protein ACTSRG_11040 [Candidatus Helarchaeota archaeon]
MMMGLHPQYAGYQYTPFVWIPLALTGNIIGDILFLLFVNGVFYEYNKKLTVFSVVVGIVLAGLMSTLVPTPSLNPLTHEPSLSYMNNFQIIWLLQALFTFFTGGLITVSAIQHSRRDRPLTEKRGLQLIAILGICLAITNIMFIIDESLTPYFGGNFSVFYYLGWIFAHTGVIMAYLGVVLPDWLRKHWE